MINGLSGYFRLVSDKTNDCYLSPKLIAALVNEDANPKHNCFKSDAYSLGMILLQVATLKPIDSCYDLTVF